MRLILIAAATSTAMLAACSTMNDAPADAPAGSASATLRSAAGAERGSATVSAIDGGIRVEVSGIGLPQGPHGIHIHTTGRCDGPGFDTAGAHWNPTAAMHGSRNPQGPHAGDLPNLLIGTDGRGSIGFDVPGARMTGEGGLLDADGAAFVIHAAADDLRTDPSGNSGGRIACGVFAAS